MTSTLSGIRMLCRDVTFRIRRDTRSMAHMAVRTDLWGQA